MNTIRKLFWPSVLALGFLLFLGTVSYNGPGVEAASGDNQICRIEGPTDVQLGERALYAFRVQSNEEDVFDLVGIQDTFGAEINGRGGLGYITRVTGEQQYIEGLGGGDFHATNPTLEVGSIDVENPNSLVPTSWSIAQGINPLFLDILERLEVAYGYQIEGNPCGLSILEVSEACIDEGQCSIWDNSAASEREAWAEAIEEATAGGVVSCEALMEIGSEAFLDAGGEEDELNGVNLDADPALEGGINGYWLSVCSFSTPNIVGPILDDVGFIEVTCTEVGEYKLSIFDQGVPDLPPFDDVPGGDSASITITCHGPVEAGKMSATPSPIEIVPAQGSVAHSLVTVEVEDADGNPVDGAHVVFTTDRCAIESELAMAEYDEVKALFGAYNRLAPITAIEIEESPAAEDGPDSATRQQEEVDTIDGIAATVLHCDPIHAPGVTPGPARITAVIERPGEDFILQVVVQVVGPPAPNGLSAIGSPANLICGEKAQIEATVLDAIGQFVSDHTLVEITTNYGGVLAGTGAVAGQAGPVVPLSSTVAETFGGKATFFLLTSDAHVGKYEVVITTGGGAGVTGSNQTGSGGLLGGLWTTPPVSVQLTFECAQPAAPAPAAPTTTGPSTGQSIKPPSTGDAGLVDYYTGDALPWFLGGVAALAIAAFLSVRFARE